MSTFVPKEVQAGLDRARKQALKKASRLRIVVGDRSYPILRMWKSGFSVDAEGVPNLRGYADLHDGAVHLFQCLIVASEEDGTGAMSYEFKRLTAVSERAALDFAQAPDAPVALLERH